MPLPLSVLKKLDEADCYVSSPSVNSQKITSYLEKNQETTFTITDILQALREQEDRLTIPDVNKTRFNKTMIYKLLHKLSKQEASPIKKKGSYFWFDKKDAGK